MIEKESQLEFYERNETALQGEKDALEKQAQDWGNNAPMLYPLQGTTMIRILPPYSDAGVFFKQISKHRVKVGTKMESFICPAFEHNMPCAVCAKGAELTATKDEAKMEFARDQLRPRNAYLYNVLCHSGPANNKGELPEFGKVYVFEVGVMVHRQIISLDQDPATGWANVTDAQAGVQLLIKRTGQRLDTKYEVNPHGAGRTDLFKDCESRGVDPGTLSVFNLDEVYEIPEDEMLEKIVSSLTIGAGGFHGTSTAIPTAKPVAPASAPVASPAAPVAAPPTTAPEASGVSPAASAPVPQPPAVPTPPSAE